MGLGRIGRNLFRLLYSREDIKIAAISELAEPEPLEYLLRFDTILGQFPDEVSIREGDLYAYGRRIPLVRGEGAAPWGDLGVDVVLEATARSRSRAELEEHLEAGAKRVIVCGPPADPPDATIVAGVNDETLRPEHRIVSNATSTVHCIAPILKLFLGAFGIERAVFNTVHSYTGRHHLADVPEQEDPRLGRAAAENIIPQRSRSPAILRELLPALEGRLTGSAMSVPVRNGSAVDLVCWHRDKITPTAINEVVRTAAGSSPWRRILAYEDDPIVSTDIARTSYSSVFDSLSTMVMGEKVSKTLAWFDSGFGFAQRAVELVERFAELDRAGRAA
jgi:glyceraldehyde 3-phosphate dehydrogenase